MCVTSTHWASRLSPQEKLPEPTKELQAGVLRYFAIIHVPFILHELAYLSKDPWRMLLAEHRRALTALRSGVVQGARRIQSFPHIRQTFQPTNLARGEENSTKIKKMRVSGLTCRQPNHCMPHPLKRAGKLRT
jgi:hypothetical protein